MEKTSKKKILSAVSFFLSAIIFIFAVCVFIVTITARANGRPAFIFGYSMAIVATGSMAPEINVGDFVLIRSCDISEMEEGQNAVFMGLSGDYKDKCIVHKVVEKITVDDDNGNEIIELTTMGIYNGTPDREKVTAENFLGVEVYHSAALGTVMLFLQNPINWAYILVILVALAIVISQIKRIVKTARSGGKPNSPPVGEEPAEQLGTAEKTQISAESVPEKVEASPGDGLEQVPKETDNGPEQKT